MMSKGSIENSTLISVLCSLWSRNREGGAVKIIVRETYQDPKFFGRPSFTIKRGRDEFRPYAKESLLTRNADAEETEEDGEEPAEELDGMHTVESAEDEVEVPEADEDTRKEDIY